MQQFEGDGEVYRCDNFNDINFAICTYFQQQNAYIALAPLKLIRFPRNDKSREKETRLCINCRQHDSNTNTKGIIF